MVGAVLVSCAGVGEGAAMPVLILPSRELGKQKNCRHTKRLGRLEVLEADSARLSASALKSERLHYTPLRDSAAAMAVSTRQGWLKKKLRHAWRWLKQPHGISPSGDVRRYVHLCSILACLWTAFISPLLLAVPIQVDLALMRARALYAKQMQD